MKNKKIEKPISDYFRELAKKSWAKRKANLLKKVAGKSEANNSEDKK